MRGFEDFLDLAPRAMASTGGIAIDLEFPATAAADELPVWMKAGFIVVASVCLWASLIGGACAITSALAGSAAPGAVLESRAPSVLPFDAPNGPFA